MFKATRSATRTTRTQAERLNGSAGFDGLPLPARKLGMPEPTDVRYDYRGGHPITSATPEQHPVSEPKMKPSTTEPAERSAPFELDE